MNHTTVDRHREVEGQGLFGEKGYGKIPILEADFNESKVRLKKGFGFGVKI